MSIGIRQQLHGERERLSFHLATLRTKASLSTIFETLNRKMLMKLNVSFDALCSHPNKHASFLPHVQAKFSRLFSILATLLTREMLKCFRKISTFGASKYDQEIERKRSNYLKRSYSVRDFSFIDKSSPKQGKRKQNAKITASQISGRIARTRQKIQMVEQIYRSILKVRKQ